MKRGRGGLLVVAGGLLAAGCGAPVPVGVSGQAGGRQLAMGEMGGGASSAPSTQPLAGPVDVGFQPPGATRPWGAGGGSFQPGTQPLAGPVNAGFQPPGAAWSQGGGWQGAGPRWPPPPVMSAGPGLPHDYPEYRHSPYYPSTPYDVWKFWETAQHTNPFFHHRYRYPELPHTPQGPLQWGAPGYPGGPPMGPGFGR